MGGEVVLPIGYKVWTKGLDFGGGGAKFGADVWVSVLVWEGIKGGWSLPSAFQPI